MSRSPVSLIRQAAGPLAGDPPASSDGECLARYLGSRDEAAFAEVVRRNGPLVLRACRAVLGDASSADDAFQLTFLRLARHASGLTGSACLAGWLHTAAVQVAGSIRRENFRRLRRERANRVASPTAPTAGLAWQEVREKLDIEIARLPEQYRLPILLCYVQGLTYDAAARRIGCPSGALRGRLERGRQLLRKRLARLGLPALLAATTAGTPPLLAAGVPEATARAIRSAKVGGLLGSTITLHSAGLVVCAAALVAGVCVLASPTADPQEPRTPPETVVEAAANDHPRTDIHGDPLPPGAIARLGADRFNHGQTIERVVLSPDGKRILSTGNGRTKLWDALTGRSVTLWPGAFKPAEGTRIWFTPAAGTLAAGVMDKKATWVVDAVTGEVVRELPTPMKDWVIASGLSPDAKTLMVFALDLAANKKVVRAYNADSGRWTILLETTSGNGLDMFAFSADSKRVRVHFSDGSVEVWDVPESKFLLRVPGSGVTAYEPSTLSPDGKLLGRCDLKSNKVRLWDLTTGKEQPELPDQPKEIGQAVAFSPDGGAIATIVKPNGIRLWDMAGRKRLRDITGHDFQLFDLAFGPGGKRLYAADGSRVSVWDSTTGAPLDDLGGHRYSIGAVAWSPDGKRLNTGAGYTDAVGRVWDPVSGRKVFDLLGHKFGVDVTAYSPDGKFLATGGQDGTVRLWDPATGKELHRFDAKDGRVYALAFRPDGRSLVASGRKALHVWDMAAWAEARTIAKSHPSPALGLQFLPGGTRLLIADYVGGHRVIDFADGGEKAQFGDVSEGPTVNALSPSGELVLTGHSNGSVLGWEVATGRALGPLVGPVPADPDAAISGLAISPDGRMVAVVAWKKPEIRVFEAASGSERFRLPGHADGVRCAAFSPDGSRLISAGNERTLLVWDVTEVNSPAPPPKDVNAAWDALAHPDAAKGFAAVRWLAADPPRSIPVITSRLRSLPAPDPKAVAGVIEKLQSPEFADREAASKELGFLADSAVDQLREAAARSTSPEVARRLAEILRTTNVFRITGDRLRVVRAVEVLERIGTVDARKILTALAAGQPGARATREARSVLARLRADRP